MKLIVGLGNPGPLHVRNRHNVGYRCLERLAERQRLSFGRVMFRAYVTSGQVSGIRVLLAKPLTFMNLSGQAVRPLLRWYRLAPQDLLVVCDDLDLPLGKLRLRQTGGTGGHKGLRSIVEALGTEAFPRLRVGIGRPQGGEPEDYVLSDFPADDLIVMEKSYDCVAEAIETFISKGMKAAMNQFNVREMPG